MIVSDENICHVYLNERQDNVCLEILCSTRYRTLKSQKATFTGAVNLHFRVNDFKIFQNFMHKFIVWIEKIAIIKQISENTKVTQVLRY